MKYMTTPGVFAVAGDTVITMRSLSDIIRRYKIEPDANGNYHITDEIVAEAKALDQAGDCNERHHQADPGGRTIALEVP